MTKKYFSLQEVKQNIAIAIPVAISQLGHMAVAVADTIMAGNLGALPLAAATLAISIFIPFMMISVGMSYGITPMVAIADGENNLPEIVKILKNGFWLNMIMNFLLFIILLLLVQLLPIINPNPEIVALAKPFFILQSLSLIPLSVFLIIKQFLEGLAITRVATMITIIANVINIGLIIVFTQGFFQLPNLGLTGIAYATVIARLFMLIAIVFYFMVRPDFKVYRKHFQIIKIEFKFIIHLFKNSIPIGLQLMLESGAFGFAAIMAGWIGAKEIAAHQISLNIAAITYMAATGIAAATTVRVGHEWGKKNYTMIRTAAFTALLVVFIYELISCLSFILFKDLLPLVYIREKIIVELSASLLMITALFQVSDGLQVVAMGALRGIEDIRIPTIVAVIAYWLLGLPLGYFLAFKLHLGVQGIWYGLLAGLSISAVLLCLRVHKKTSFLKRGL
ncbi:MAG: MATE family efflux transporter [Cytophagales bacterium]|nr:MAG: MATE family efflux transporter [Cytophagales bacterium]